MTAKIMARVWQRLEIALGLEVNILESILPPKA